MRRSRVSVQAGFGDKGEGSGPGTSGVAIGLNNLALLYTHEQKNGEAESMYKRASWIDEKVFGSDHPAYAIDLANLAVLYSDEGRQAEAVPLLEQAVKIDERALGANSPTLALHLFNVSVALRQPCRNGEADVYQQQADRIPGHPTDPNPVRAECK